MAKEIKVVGANGAFEHLLGQVAESDLQLLDLGTYQFQIEGEMITVWPYTWVYVNGSTELEGWASNYQDQYGRITLKICDQ